MRVIALVPGEEDLTVLCEDGSVWKWNPMHGIWEETWPPLPRTRGPYFKLAGEPDASREVFPDRLYVNRVDPRASTVSGRWYTREESR